MVYRISLAKESVWGTVYTMDDRPLVDSLIDAQERGLEVRLCADNQQFNTPSSRNQPQCMTELVEKGVEIKVGHGKTIHQKTWLIDGDIAIIGSGNATTNSRQRCSEFGVETTDPNTARELKSKIDRLWEEGREVTPDIARQVRGRSSSSSVSRRTHVA